MRPSRRTAAAAASPKRSRRPGVISNLHSVLLEPSFHFRSNSLKIFLRSGLESHHEHGLCVGGANESPAITEENPDAVHVDHFMRGRKVFLRRFDDAELQVVGACNAKLGC